ncbi:FAD-dependent monooxygenase [Sphaerisporangium sp. NPDC004334]
MVVGAGPTGLLLAGDLCARGVGCTVLERGAHGSNLSRAFVLHARSLEQLDVRGVADELIAGGVVIRRMRLFDDPGLDLSRLPSRFPFAVSTPQYNTENVLEDRAVGLGAEIVRGAEVVGVRQDDQGVLVDTRADGAARTWRARFAVGADGVRSTVRQAVGLPFPGRSAVRSVMLADVRLAEPPPWPLALHATEEGFSFIASYGDGWYRVIAWDRRQPPGDAPVTLAEVADVVRRATGRDFGMGDARWLSRFHSDERQVPSYRVGRVLLAGDAAHVHSPAGGQGMNTGLQDAVNLAWRLAAEVQGWASPTLLDGYDAERRPVGRAVLRFSGTLLSLALGSSRRTRAIRAVLPSVLRGVRPVNDRLAMAISGLAVAYPPPEGVPRPAGRRAPDIPLAGEPGRLYEALRGGRFVLAVSPDDPASVAVRPGGRVDRVAPEERRRPAMLVRPDGYIAWAADKVHPGARAVGLRAALAAWCGESSPASVRRSLRA